MDSATVPVEGRGLGADKESDPEIGQVEAEEAPEEQRERLDPGERNQVHRLEGEATPKTTEALRKGADATRGRGRSRQKIEERN